MTSRNARMSVVADLSTAPCSSSNPQSRFDVRAIGAHPSIRARPRQLTLCFQVNRERDVVGERVTVEAREPGVELGLEVRERGDLSEMREGLLAHATPEALHLAAR